VTELSPRARDLFARARREGAPTAAQKAALLSRIETRAAAPVKASGWAWLVLGGSALVIVAILAFFASESSKGAEVGKPSEPLHVAAPPVAGAIEEPRVEIAVPEPQPEPEIVPEVPRVVAPAARARTRSAATVQEAAPGPVAVQPAPVTGCELAAEMALVNSARMFCQRGQFDQAVELLEEHRRDCRDGAMAMERNVLLARITCERGDIEAGRALGAPYRDGAYGSLIDQSCGEDR
jgi:hypothetical protein